MSRSHEALARELREEVNGCRARENMLQTTLLDMEAKLRSLVQKVDSQDSDGLNVRNMINAIMQEVRKVVANNDGYEWVE